MKKKQSLIIFFIILQFFFCGVLLSTLNHITASSSTSNNYDLKSSAVDFSNATVVSDGFNSTYWNDDNSYDPTIAVDSSDNIHVVWDDFTNGVWGGDVEIMYATYNTATGWSNATVISDGYDGTYWNDGNSYEPAIAVDSSDNVHVVWEDHTSGVWGTDYEIMYVTYNTATGWSNVTVISDGLYDIYWNDGNSLNPAIAVDSSDKAHVVWEDYTDGGWGIDTEIMYSYFTFDLGWSIPRIISDGYNGSFWNNGNSLDPAIAVDSSNAVHVVWEDGTDGVWGIDFEIMYANFTILNSWSNISVLSDGFGGIYWNDGLSRDPTIAISTNQVHVVWEDETDGVWGTDYEIMHVNFAIPVPPVVSAPGGIPFGNFYLLFIAVSIIGLVVYKKRKL